MIEESENIVKKTCRELGITQKELAEITGFSKNAISNWSRGATLPESARKYFLIIKENFELNKLKEQILHIKGI